MRRGELMMVQLLQFPQEECASYLKEQIINLMKNEWPQAFEDKDEAVLWPSCPDTSPISLVLVEDNIVISHVAVPHKYIKHKGQTFKAFGLSEVMTNPSYRNQGFGLKLIKEAGILIEKSEPDISIFTCKPSLVSFYTQGGWEFSKSTHLIGGTLNKPFRSDSLGLSTMIRFISDKAQEIRLTFEETDVYLELGERKLW
jgi:predicted acetyltransferase